MKLLLDCADMRAITWISATVGSYVAFIYSARRRRLPRESLTRLVLLNPVKVMFGYTDAVNNQKYLSCRETRLKVLGRLEWALDMVNVKPESNPLHEVFWDDLIGPSQALLKEIRRAKSPDDDHDGNTVLDTGLEYCAWGGSGELAGFDV